MNKKRKTLPLYAIVLFSGMMTLPPVAQAQGTLASMVPAEMNLTNYLIIGALLGISLLLFFVFQRRYHAAASQLKDVTSELDTTRRRLNESNTELEQSKQEHQATATRYQNILFDAGVGMFQMDLSGRCTYINTALQAMTGLYPKKALKEGLSSAVHPDDRERFSKAWERFTESDVPLNETFRFQPDSGTEVHVLCRANKVLDAHQDVESYIGWVTDVTPFHEEQELQRQATARYESFIDETVEGFYKLVPETPIALDAPPEKITAAILEHSLLSECNDTFASVYGTKARHLTGKSISDLKDGIGPFRGAESIRKFVEADCKLIGHESIRTDSTGSRLNLVNHVIGIVEDNRLVAIWGSQSNITQQKREKAELQSQVQFMHRILDSLPADVHVKDTRCRYLYASKKLADRTGIPKEDWIGKTIFEVMPGTPHDHDQSSIDTMKSGKLTRRERPYEARGKSGWMQTLQTPLVSEEGLVEGVIGLSLDISDRKAREDQVIRQHRELEGQLKHTKGELAQSRIDYSKTATTLSEAIQKLKIAQVEKTNREHEFKEHLAERKRAEEVLRRSEQALLARRQQLEEQLAERLEELEAETDKRRKWEELLAIKEDELCKAEALCRELNEHYEHETALREQAEASLAANRAALEKIRAELATLYAERESEREQLKKEHDSALNAEQKARAKAERQLARTTEFLESTQEQVKRMTEQHTEELEKEVAERKAAAEKLIRSMEELDELRQQFSTRLEAETKTIKQELARKQIREKALRQHEKDLEARIKDLETTLQLKTREYTEQIQAREGAEVEKQQIEQKMEQLTKRQQELVDRQTQKLHLNIAEIRLDEVKLRKRVGDLEARREELEEALAARETELENARQTIRKKEAELAETRATLKQLSGDQSKVVAQETEKLQQQLREMKKATEELRDRMADMQGEKKELEKNLEYRSEDLTKAAREYRKIVDAYKASQAKLKELTERHDAEAGKKLKPLKAELEKLRASEKELAAREQELQHRVAEQQEEITQLHETVKAENANREDAEKGLRELQQAFEASQENADELVLQQTRELTRQLEEYQKNETELHRKLQRTDEALQDRDKALANLRSERKEAVARMREIESKLADIRKEHQAELKKTLAEVKELNQSNGHLLDELNEAVQSTLNPVVKTTDSMEQADNLSDQQKHELAMAGHRCRSLIDSVNYRAELTHLSDGAEEVTTARTDLHELIADMDRRFCHRAEAKKLFFAVSFAQYQSANNVPQHIATDAQKIRKVLSILLGYAVEKTEKGRIGLHAARNSAESEGMHIAFELTFTPAQPKDDLLSNIFSSEKEGEVDLKYGLTLARRYINMLRGKTVLECRDAGVTALTISIPVERADSEIIVPGKRDERQAGAA